MMVKNKKLYILFLLIVLGCREKVKNDDVPHIIIQMEEDKTMRVDYYEEPKILVFYFTEVYGEKEFLEKYPKLLLSAKNKWDFAIIDYIVHNKEYKNDKVIYRIKELNEKLLDIKINNVKNSIDGFYMELN